MFAALRTSSVYRIARLLRKFGEYEVSCKRQRVRAGEIVAAIQIASGQLHDLGRVAEPKLADERHSRKIGQLIEIAPVDLRQFIGKLPWENAPGGVQIPYAPGGGKSGPITLSRFARGVDVRRRDLPIPATGFCASACTVRSLASDNERGSGA